MPHAIVVMGVSGSGKSTVGMALAQALGCPFYDGDDFHPPANIEKMRSGIPLNDEDRYAWLARLHDLIMEHLARGETVAVACSALKRRYRDQLRGNSDQVLFVYLQGSFDLIWERMQAREGHYMKPQMLQSQFDTLEAPTVEEALIVEITQPTQDIVAIILRHFQSISGAS